MWQLHRADHYRAVDIVAAALECKMMTQAARLESLSVAFAILDRNYKATPKAMKLHPENGVGKRWSRPSTGTTCAAR
jgi:hypothetical protein